MLWQTTRFDIDLAQPQVMGIVNATPDSFSDGGQYDSTLAALAHCEQLLRDGAHILDIGAESSRPGAQPVPVILDHAGMQVWEVVEQDLASESEGLFGAHSR